MGLYVDAEDLGYFYQGSTVFIEGRPHVVRALRRGTKGHEVAFDGVMDRSSAESIRNLEVFVVERRQLGESEFWPDDLIGLEVRPAGGSVVGISYGPAQDRLVVERDGERFEVPFVDELVPAVSTDEGYVEIVELPGLTQRPEPE